MEKFNNTENESDYTPDELKKVQITVYTFYSILSALNFIYFATRIIRLKEKRFHLLMFVLLQLSFTSCIIEYAFWDVNSLTKWIGFEIFIVCD